MFQAFAILGVHAVRLYTTAACAGITDWPEAFLGDAIGKVFCRTCANLNMSVIWVILWYWYDI